MKTKRLLLSLGAVLCLYSLSNAGSLSAEGRYSNISLTESLLSSPPAWKLDATISNVEFYHVITECNGKTVVFLKFINKNNQEIKISWKENVKTQIRMEDNVLRGKQQLTLAPGETMTQDCSQTACKACMVLPEQVAPTYPAQIKEFSFRDISVIK